MSSDTAPAPRPLHPRHGIHDPTVSTPARAPRSLRRTSTTDMLRPDGLLGPLVLVGRARDLYTNAAGEGRVLGEAGYEARVDYVPGREIRSLVSRPANDALERLVGLRASSGFRAALDEAIPEEREALSLLYGLLDDLPVTALVSGFAMGFAFQGHPVPKGQLSQHPDLCAGWRRGGTLLTGVEETGIVPLVTGPEAPSLARADDPLAWHVLPALPPNGMRRHRRLDLTPGAKLGVDAFFRDLHVEPEGRHTVIHEYTVRAEVDPEALRFDAIEAKAQALPWVECNPAPASAARLRGRLVRGLRPAVRTEFTGITTCTHLNDTLRSLEDIAGLAPRLAACLAEER